MKDGLKINAFGLFIFFLFALVVSGLSKYEVREFKEGGGHKIYIPPLILNDISGGGSHSDPYFYSISKGFEKAVKSGDPQKVLRFLNEKKIANKVESKFLLAQMEVKARQPFSLISKEDLDNVEKNWDHLRPHPWAVYYIENFYHGQSKTAPAFFVEETLKLEKNANLIMVASIVAILLVIIFSFTAFYLKDRRSAFPITA